MEDLENAVNRDEENLVVIAITSALCPYSAKWENFLEKLSAPIEPTKHAKFYRVHLPDGDAVARHLKVNRTPTAFFFLKGNVRCDPFMGSNTAKLSGIFRNELIKRNEEMRDYDEAKIAAMQPKETEEDAEVEEEEED
jgi:hypothetical protein